LWYPLLSRGRRTPLDAGQSPPGCTHVATDLRGSCAKRYGWPGANALGIRPCGTETTPVRVPGQRLVHRPPPRRSTPTFGFLPFGWRRVPCRPVKQGHCVVPGQFFRQMPGQGIALRWGRGGGRGGKTERWQGPGPQPHPRDPGWRPRRLVGAARSGRAGCAGLRVTSRHPVAPAAPGGGKPGEPGLPEASCNPGAARLPPPGWSGRGSKRGAASPACAMRVEAAIAGGQGWGGHGDGSRFRWDQGRCLLPRRAVAWPRFLRRS